MPRHNYTHYLEHTLQKTEDDWLANPTLHFAQAKALKAVLFDHPDVKTVVEVGCATGNLAKRVPEGIVYTGVDASENALKMAREKNPDKRFIQSDVFQLGCPKGRAEHDLVVCFATMKHFALDEWEEALGRILSLGRRGVFDIPVADRVQDDGVDFPHVWVTEKWLMEILAGLEYDVVSVDKTGIEWMVEVSENQRRIDAGI